MSKRDSMSGGDGSKERNASNTKKRKSSATLLLEEEEDKHQASSRDEQSSALMTTSPIAASYSVKKTENLTRTEDCLPDEHLVHNPSEEVQPSSTTQQFQHQHDGTGTGGGSLYKALVQHSTSIGGQNHQLTTTTTAAITPSTATVDTPTSLLDSTGRDSHQNKNQQQTRQPTTTTAATAEEQESTRDDAASPSNATTGLHEGETEEGNGSISTTTNNASTHAADGNLRFDLSFSAPASKGTSFQMRTCPTPAQPPPSVAVGSHLQAPAFAGTVGRQMLIPVQLTPTTLWDPSTANVLVQAAAAQHQQRLSHQQFVVGRSASAPTAGGASLGGSEQQQQKQTSLMTTSQKTHQQNSQSPAPQPTFVSVLPTVFHPSMVMQHQPSGILASNINYAAVVERSLHAAPVGGVAVTHDHNNSSQSSASSLGTRGPLLYMSHTDDNLLTENQILLRKQIEFFEAPLQQVGVTATGRKRPIMLNQVGIQCRHCRHVPFRQRTKGALYYPAKLQGIYQASQNMLKTHLCKSCPNIDPGTQQQLSQQYDQGQRKKVGHAGQEYWAKTAKAQGIMESSEDNGLRFKHKL